MSLASKVIVGMADLKASRDPCILTTLGLGSCVGIAFYDKINKVIGMAHAMLPDSTQISNNSNKYKFVDTSIIELIRQMQLLGAKKEYITSKIAGGAQMFQFSSTNESMRIGDRNVEATIKLLKQHKIPLLGRDVGLNFGRTIELDSSDGKLLIKTIDHGIKTI